MNSLHGRYIARHTLISIMISCAIGVFFVWLVFSGQSSIPLWGAKGLAFDFLPQTFMVAFMGSLVPSLLTRKDLRLGKIASLDQHSRFFSRHVVIRALLIAVVAMVVGSGLAIFLLNGFLSGPVSFSEAFAIKITYCALVAIVVTPLAVAATLKREVEI